MLRLRRNVFDEREAGKTHSSQNYSQPDTIRQNVPLVFHLRTEDVVLLVAREQVHGAVSKHALLWTHQDVVTSFCTFYICNERHNLLQHRTTGLRRSSECAVLTLFAGGEEADDGRVDVPGRRVSRRRRVDLRQDTLRTNDRPDGRLESQLQIKTQNKKTWLITSLLSFFKNSIFSLTVK